MNLQQPQSQQQHAVIRKRQESARNWKTEENATKKEFGKNAWKLVINAN